MTAKTIISIEIEVGLHKFALHCNSSASLEHCKEAVRIFGDYIQRQIEQVNASVKVEEESKPQIQEHIKE